MKAPNIFDSIVMVMTRYNVKFMKCTEHLRITNTCSAGNEQDVDNILQMCVQMLLRFALIISFLDS